MTSQILDGTLESSVQVAARFLQNDEVVGIPTETVYGLAALATSKVAVDKIYAIKGRPRAHPLILHIGKVEDLPKWATNIPKYALRLAGQLWPGPLTLILQRSGLVLNEITGSRRTVALRIPNHLVTLRLLEKLGDGLVAPSANKFGMVSPTSAEHVVADLGGLVPLVLDGGECQIGVESTIVDCTDVNPQILRHGAITPSEIETICRSKLVNTNLEPRASGMLEKHYSPVCQVKLAKTRLIAEEICADLTSRGTTVEILDYGTDTKTYAKELYYRLRLADQKGVQVVTAILPSAEGIGLAIIDRLKKASK